MAGEYAARGVWKAPTKVDGSPAAMVVDSKQRQVGLIVLHPGVDRGAVKRMLMVMLDLMDPLPKLQLVQDDNDVLANLDPA